MDNFLYIWCLYKKISVYFLNYLAFSVISRHDRLTCNKVSEKLAKKFQRNWAKTAKLYDILTVSYKKTIAYKMKIPIFLYNPSMPIFHTSWYLTWCKILKKNNEQFSGKIRKGAISYKKVLIKWKYEFFGKIRLRHFSAFINP